MTQKVKKGLATLSEDSQPPQNKREPALKKADSDGAPS